MGKAKLFEYYQPNDKDLKDKYGDCTIRALAKVFDCTWVEAFDLQVPLAREAQIPDIFFAPASTRNELMARLGFKYTGITNKKGTKRPTVWQFAKDHPTGRYILNVANHEVACVDGKYYDTWDSGYKPLYGYYTKED